MKVLPVFIFSIALVGCSFNDRVPLESYSQPPELGYKTQTQKDLEALPPPTETVTVSVYRFDDQTGQNKPAEVPQYSRAVTQGGLSILKKALLDAGGNRWFRVLERGGLDDLLQERKIVRAIREEYVGEGGQPLPPLGPLLYSGLLLEGGIVSYESNVLTGGIGARYLGIGGSTEYRRDVVTVYLRAVSVTSGEVLVAVNTEKAIFSTAVSGGIFRYVSFDKIVEGEAGYTVNEPPQLAVRQAIELAIYSMIIEGAKRDLWQFSDPRSGSRLIEDYSRKYGSLKPAPVQTAKTTPPPKPEPKKEEARQADGQPSPYEFSYTIRPGAATSRAESRKPETTRSALSVKGEAKPSAKPSEARRGRPGTDEDPLPRGFYVQIKALLPQETDQKQPEMVAALKSLGYSVVFQRARVESVTFHRILVGPFKSRNEARSELPLIKEFAPSQDEPFIKSVS